MARAADNELMEAVSPASARARFRAGLRVPTASWAPGFAQANLIVVPQDAAGEFERFARLNPRPCPLLDIGEPGDPVTRLAPGADLRTDLPAYRVWEHGRCVAEPGDILARWRDDLVAFLTGCSFTFERALLAAGVPVRHLEQASNVAMYVTSQPCRSAGRFSGPLVVSMRPVPAPLVPLAAEVTARFPAAHGAPVQCGDPAALGIEDLATPDFGDPVAPRPGDVPVFWACGVTPQSVVATVKPDFCITHYPGCMLVTDLKNSSLAVM